MGGRGSKSGMVRAGTVYPGTRFPNMMVQPPTQQPTIPPQPNPAVANQAPSPQNTPVLQGGVDTLSKMSDDQLAAIYNASRNVDMPNHLSDVDDKTQKFVYAAGLNEKPVVLDNASFKQYMSDNNISQGEVLARSVGSANYTVNGTRITLSPHQVTAMIKDSDLTYVGGKHGGMLHGAGTYFDQNGGRPTGYSNGATAIAVLSKTRARVIQEHTLMNRVSSWSKSHPKFARAVGPVRTSNMSIYALAMGYNTIQFGSYHNVIDRTALVMRSNDY